MSATWMGIHRRKMHPKQWEEEVKRREEQKVLKRKQSSNPEQNEDEQGNPALALSQSNVNSQPQQDMELGAWH